MVKNPPAMQETQVWSLGWEDSLEKGMATHAILAWTKEPDRATVHVVSKSQIWQSNQDFYFHRKQMNNTYGCRKKYF